MHAYLYGLATGLAVALVVYLERSRIVNALRKKLGTAPPVK